MQEEIIKVSSEELVKKSKEISDKIQSIRKNFSDIEDAVMMSRKYWIGNAADNYRDIYKELYQEAENIFHRIEDRSNSLYQIAKNYENAEEELVRISKDLPTNLIH